MAYVNFSGDPLLAPHLAPALLDAAPAAPARTGLSGLEWSVVALARQDRIASLRHPGRLSIALGRVFGTRRGSPNLADPQLEALRRIAVWSWHRGYAVPEEELAGFLAAGFSIDQYETMQASIGAARGERGMRRAA